MKMDKDILVIKSTLCRVGQPGLWLKEQWIEIRSYLDRVKSEAEDNLEAGVLVKDRPHQSVIVTWYTGLYLRNVHGKKS